MALALQLIGLLRGDPYSYCHDQDVTYSHRVDDKEHYNWCTVPESGFDAVLFGAVALLAASILHGKFSALWILLAGAACQMVAMPLNLGRFGNSLALWLGITPADLFLYVFLPPMLLDSAVRIDFYIFNKMLLHVLSFAFLLVVASTAMLVPLLLYAFNLRAEGWLWQHAALFAAMIAPTDPIAVSGLLKTGGGPEQLVVLMEGEALFNDASAITLFSIFFDLVKQMNHGATGNEKGILAQLGNVVLQTAWLAGGGLLIGLACGVVTRGLLKWMRQRGAKPPEELAITLAMAYLSFYLANAPGHVSGVIAVVSYGLYGSATAKWNMSAKVVETGAFELFWDTLSFAMNGIVFFYSGASAVNFFVRSAKDLTEYGGMPEFALAFWRLPLIFLSVYLARGLCILLFNPIFMLLGAGLELPSIIFATVGGLRGAVSLILVQMVVTEQDPTSENKRVIAQIALYTAGLVLLSLLINAPLIPLLLDWTGLSKVSPVKQRVRAKAVRALLRYTDTALNNLRHDEDEMLRGVDWGAVGRYVDLRKELEDFAPQQSGVLTQEDVQHITDRPSAQTHLQRAAAWTLDKLTRCCAVIASPLLCCGGRPEEPGLTEPLLLSEGGGGEQDAAEQGEAGSAPHPAPIREDSGDSHSPAPPRALRDSAFNTPAARSPRDSAFDPESSGLSSDDESDGEEHPDTRGLSGLYATLRQAVRGEGLECGTVVAKSDEANVMEEQTQDFGRDVPFIGRFKPSDKSKAHPEPPRQAPAGEGQQYDVENPEPGSGGPLGSFVSSGSMWTPIRAQRAQQQAQQAEQTRQAGQAPEQTAEPTPARQQLGGNTDTAQQAQQAGNDSGDTQQEQRAQQARQAHPLPGEGSTQESTIGFPAGEPTPTQPSSLVEPPAQMPNATTVPAPQEQALQPEQLPAATNIPASAQQGPVSEAQQTLLGAEALAAVETAGSAVHPAPITPQQADGAGPEAQRAAHAESDPSSPARTAPEHLRRSISFDSATSFSSFATASSLQSQPSSGHSGALPQLPATQSGALLQPASQGPAAQSPGGQGAALPPRSPQPSGISYFTSAGPKSVFEAEDWAERMIRRRRSSEPGTGSGSAGGSRSESPGSATSAGLVSSGSRSPLLASTAEQAALARLSPRLLPSPHRPPPSPGTGRQAAQPPAQRAGRGLGPSQVMPAQPRPEPAGRGVGSVSGRAAQLAEPPGQQATPERAGRGLDSDASQPQTLQTPFAAAEQQGISAASAAIGDQPSQAVPPPSAEADVQRAAVGTAPAAAVAGQPSAAPAQVSIDAQRAQHAATGSMHGITRTDSAGEEYLVVPQPFITPHMRQPGSSAPAQPPSLEWVSVDLHQLERQQAAERRRARRQHAKEPSGTIGLAQRSTSRSAGKQEAHTRHRALHKALSGPLHMQMIDSGEIRDVASEEAAVDIEAELLAETRVRLVHGLKRYFHGKRAEGLLSARGVQILDHACDVTMDQSGQPMSMWQHIEREVCGRYMVRGLARTLFGLRKLNLARRRWGKPSRWLADRLLLPPLLKAAEVIGRILNRTMLLSMECAVEYWLALNWSPQAQWLEYEEAGEAGLREEVRAESRRVWQFILEREVEAPERFRSIQSYRAAMALLRQQGLFVEQLFSSGMVNEVEREKLLEPIEKRERDLEKLGSIGRPPTITEVLRSTPVLHELPEPVFEGILRRSQLVRYEPGNVIWSPPTKPTQAPATPAPLTIEEVASSPQGAALAGATNRVLSEEQTGAVPAAAAGAAGTAGAAGAAEGMAVPSPRPGAAGKAAAQAGAAASKGSTAGGKGVHIVMAGLVKSAYINSDGETEDYYLGTGGVIGLLPALVGEALPGSGGATAVGNALMQGPVVFHIPQSLIRRIRRKAAAGDPRLQQLELDLFRMAALAVLDRLQSEVVAAVVTLFQQRTVQQAQRSARDRLQVGASGGTSTGEAGGEIAPVGADAVAGLDPKRIWKAAQKHVSTVMEELHAGLRDGALVELRAGQTYPQQSSLVLLRGTLCMTGAATDVPNAQAGVAVPQGSYDVTVQYRGPCVLPWLWDGAAAQSGQGGGQQQLLAQAMTVTAGRSGAVLVACPVAKPRQVSTKEKRDSEDEEDGSPTSQSEPDRALCPLLRPDLEGSTRACRLPEGTSDESAEHAGPAKARPAATASSNRMRVVRVAKAA